MRRTVPLTYRHPRNLKASGRSVQEGRTLQLVRADLAEQRAGTDAEGLGRPSAVAIACAEAFLNRRALNLLKRQGRGKSRGRFSLFVRNEIQGQVVNADDFLAREDYEPLQHVA